MPHAGPLLESPLDLSNLLQVGVKARPNDPALMSLEAVISWSDLDKASSRLAANYLALGLKPGDRFASLMPNRVALILHYIACFKAGLVLTPLNFRYKKDLHVIKKADGPERIEREWWLQDGEHRDYYAVEDEEGKRYWLFRSGHYNEVEKPKWFLHGFFA